MAPLQKKGVFVKITSDSIKIWMVFVYIQYLHCIISNPSLHTKICVYIEYNWHVVLLCSVSRSDLEAPPTSVFRRIVSDSPEPLTPVKQKHTKPRTGRSHHVAADDTDESQQEARSNRYVLISYEWYVFIAYCVYTVFEIWYVVVWLLTSKSRLETSLGDDNTDNISGQPSFSTHSRLSPKDRCVCQDYEWLKETMDGIGVYTISILYDCQSFSWQAKMCIYWV